jgi:hypothetical protein
MGAVKHIIPIVLYPNKDGVYNQAEPIVIGAPYPKKHGRVLKPSRSSEIFEPFHHTCITQTHGLLAPLYYPVSLSMAGWKIRI